MHTFPRRNGGNMSQIEELKTFVSERLHAVASEIVGAIEKTITDYEEKNSRLREENDRHLSLLDIILKAKLPQTQADHGTKSTPAAASPRASDSRRAHEARETPQHSNADHGTRSTPAAASPHASDSCSAREARETPQHSNALNSVFTSRTDFLKFATSAANGNCPFCLKNAPANEAHLMKRHYAFAVHFNEDGTEKFVVPCLCKDRIQISGRSHWHCPICRKIIFRRCNFEQHINKQHSITILQECQNAEIHQPPVSVFVEAPMNPEHWCQKELGSLVQEDQQTSLLLPIIGEEEMERRGLVEEQVSHPELQNSKQLQSKGDPVQKGNCQMGEQSLEADHAQYPALNIVYVSSYIQDSSEINNVESSKGCLPNSSTQPLETQPDSGDCEIRQPAGEYQHTTADKIGEWKKNHTPSSLKALNSKRRKLVKKSLPPLSSNIKKATRLSVSQDPTGLYCCKACGKAFHDMNTLRTHAQAHTVDKIHVCGLCGKHLESTESLVQHLQSHKSRNKCGICGKQFSNNARLKQHRRFHKPKGLNMSSA